MKLKVSRKDKVPAKALVSIDPDYTLEHLSSIAVAHNSGALDAFEEVYFCEVENYQFAPRNAICLLAVEENKL